MNVKNIDISIVLSGEAGQGIQTLERLLLSIFKKTGAHVFSYSEFMSRIRGGNNSTSIRISSRKIAAFVNRIDIFIPFNANAINRFSKRITKDTLIFGDSEFINDNTYDVIEVPLQKISKEAGGKKSLNIIVFGLLVGLFNLKEEISKDLVLSLFQNSDELVLKNNLNAISLGINSAKEIIDQKNVRLPDLDLFCDNNEIIMDGSDSITLGGIAGGCNFISSYPMSPGTGVLVDFAKYSKDFNIIVEQAEDEICAINMAIASWYAGGRAMVTTSGGGFALMAEGLSLAGAIESPVVLHVAQRPGPATGLPTRTEQGDLLFSLFAGHGEFPRVIFAPGDISQGFSLAQRSFYIADKYQVPVIILTDQFFLDSMQTTPDFTISENMNKNIIIKSDEKYKRYKITDDKISPRGIPGYGNGIVCIDSDEHDEGGYITEDFIMREKQNHKRMSKFNLLQKETLPPDLYGSANYKYLLVSWGSNLHCIREAIDLSKRDDIGLLHFIQLYPLHEDTLDYLNKAEKTIIIENNYTSQFSLIIQMLTAFKFDDKILKYNGMPFSVEEITDVISGLPESNI